MDAPARRLDIWKYIFALACVQMGVHGGVVQMLCSSDRHEYGGMVK